MAGAPTYRRVAAFKTLAAFRAHLAQAGVEIPLAEPPAPGEVDPLGAPFDFHGRRLPNRFAVLPMEGWDATPAGEPSDLTRRRWQHFGASGAGLIWGGEAVAVCPEGRANPNQLIITAQTAPALANLREVLLAAHSASRAETPPLAGLQLTHSGRFCRPVEKTRLEPRLAYHHPLLDRKFGIPANYPLVSDSQLDDLLGEYARAARLAQQAGFDFVDLKHCHGYLLHELLSAVTRPGVYGGDFEGRTRFLRRLIAAVRREAPGLELGVRLSAFDIRPFRPGAGGVGEPEPWEGAYPYAFGGSADGLAYDLGEPRRLLSLLDSLGVRLVCLTAGSPYYNPHIQRPALFPPSDGYLPPEDPLVGVARQIAVTGQLKAEFPNLVMVGSAYSYLQEYLPAAGRGVLAAGLADFIGLGRLVLAYPEFAGDVLSGQSVARKRLCRTFSDCTTAPRLGLVSGCYPLDSAYQALPDYAALTVYKTRSHSVEKETE